MLAGADGTCWQTTFAGHHVSYPDAVGTYHILGTHVNSLIVGLVGRAILIHSCISVCSFGHSPVIEPSAGYTWGHGSSCSQSEV